MYQWFKNLAFNPLKTGDEGMYRCFIKSTLGADSTIPFKLTVLSNAPDAPRILGIQSMDAMNITNSFKLFPLRYFTSNISPNYGTRLRVLRPASKTQFTNSITGYFSGYSAEKGRDFQSRERIHLPCVGARLFHAQSCCIRNRRPPLFSDSMLSGASPRNYCAYISVFQGVHYWYPGF